MLPGLHGAPGTRVVNLVVPEDIRALRVHARGRLMLMLVVAVMGIQPGNRNVTPTSSVKVS